MSIVNELRRYIHNGDKVRSVHRIYDNFTNNISIGLLIINKPSGSRGLSIPGASVNFRENNSTKKTSIGRLNHPIKFKY